MNEMRNVADKYQCEKESICEIGYNVNSLTENGASLVLIGVRGVMNVARRGLEGEESTVEGKELCRFVEGVGYGFGIVRADNDLESLV